MIRVEAFSNPDTYWVDVVRVVSVVLGAILIALMFALARSLHGSRPHTLYGICAYIAFALSAIWGQIDRLGQGLTPYLILNTIGIILGLVYIHQSWSESPNNSVAQ